MMKNTTKLTTYLLCLFLFASCISSEETNYLQAIKTAYKIQSFTEYKLKAGDRITCAISTQDQDFIEEFNTLLNRSQNVGKTFTVYGDGAVVLPFFGSVKVSGETMQSAEKLIQEKMRESITDAQVKISLANNTFTIYANERQGVYTVYKENMTIYQALAISGQTTDKMDLSRVTIIRTNDIDQTITKTFDLRTQDVVGSEFYYIKPNDFIYFRTNKNAFFNITSVQTFITNITLPLTFLLFVSTSRF